MQSIEEAKILPVCIPNVPVGATFKHHPIVRTPNFYKPEELADTGIANTDWVGFFEQILCGLHWKLAGPVPYAFRTHDGTFRKLDTGCLRFLANREAKQIEFLVDSAGYIDFVIPTTEPTNRSKPDKDWLIQQVEIPSCPP